MGFFYIRENMVVSSFWFFSDRLEILDERDFFFLFWKVKVLGKGCGRFIFD